MACGLREVGYNPPMTEFSTHSIMEVTFHLKSTDLDAEQRLRFAQELLARLTVDKTAFSIHETTDQNQLRIVTMVALVPHSLTALNWPVSVLNADFRYGGCGAAEVKINPAIVTDQVS